MNRSFRTLMMGLSLGPFFASARRRRGRIGGEKTLLEKRSRRNSGASGSVAQAWQQILLSDPNNQDALAGLARWAKLSGNDVSESYYRAPARGQPNSPEMPGSKAWSAAKRRISFCSRPRNWRRTGRTKKR